MRLDYGDRFLHRQMVIEAQPNSVLKKGNSQTVPVSHIAIIAIWGYQKMLEGARLKATEAAQEAVDSHLNSDGFQDGVRRALEVIYRRDAAEQLRPELVCTTRKGRKRCVLDHSSEAWAASWPQHSWFARLRYRVMQPLSYRISASLMYVPGFSASELPTPVGLVSSLRPTTKPTALPASTRW